MSRHKLVAKMMQNHTNLLHDEIYNSNKQFPNPNWHEGDTLISWSFLDQILSDDFLSKLSKLFEGENLHQAGYFDTLPSLLSH